MSTYCIWLRKTNNNGEWRSGTVSVEGSLCGKGVPDHVSSFEREILASGCQAFLTQAGDQNRESFSGINRACAKYCFSELAFRDGLSLGDDQEAAEHGHGNSRRLERGHGQAEHQPIGHGDDCRDKGDNQSSPACFDVLKPIKEEDVVTEHARQPKASKNQPIFP